MHSCHIIINEHHTKSALSTVASAAILIIMFCKSIIYELEHNMHAKMAKTGKNWYIFGKHAYNY